MIQTKVSPWVAKEFLEFSQGDVVLKEGLLELDLHMDLSKNKTVVSRQYCKAPLLTQKALYYDSDNPSMAYLFLMSSSGGVLQGDRYQIKISLAKNSVCNITTQGATRIYKMESDYASQNVEIDLAEKSYLEFLPDQIIPYAKSRYCQQIILRKTEDSTAIYSEIISPGRAARGELFDYEICYLKFIAQDISGNTLFVDSSRLKPGESKFGDAIMGQNSVLGTLYALVPKNSLDVMTPLIQAALDNSGMLCSFSNLPGDCGILVRLLSSSAEDTKSLILDIVRIVRKCILGSELHELRKT